jgi:hypothetical protein
MIGDDIVSIPATVSPVMFVVDSVVVPDTVSEVAVAPARVVVPETVRDVAVAPARVVAPDTVSEVAVAPARVVVPETERDVAVAPARVVVPDTPSTVAATVAMVAVLLTARFPVMLNEPAVYTWLHVSVPAVVRFPVTTTFPDAARFCVETRFVAILIQIQPIITRGVVCVCGCIPD